MSRGGTPDVTGLFFAAKIALASPSIYVNGHDFKLEPGMAVRAEIKTESGRAIDYILSSVTEVFDEAGDER